MSVNIFAFWMSGKRLVTRLGKRTQMLPPLKFRIQAEYTSHLIFSSVDLVLFFLDNNNNMRFAKSILSKHHHRHLQTNKWRNLWSARSSWPLYRNDNALIPATKYETRRRTRWMMVTFKQMHTSCYIYMYKHCYIVYHVWKGNCVTFYLNNFAIISLYINISLTFNWIKLEEYLGKCWLDIYMQEKFFILVYNNATIKLVYNIQEWLDNPTEHWNFSSVLYNPF